MAVLALAMAFSWRTASADEVADSTAPPSVATLRARLVSRAITVDGLLRPEEWPDDPTSTAHIESGDQCLPERRARWRGPDDASAVVRVAVDSEALYLGVSVRDDVSFHPGEPWWYGDGLEVFLETNPIERKPGEDAYDEGDWQIFLMPANPHLRWGVAYHGRSARFDDGGLVGVRVASRAKEGGSYDLEARLPLANFKGLDDRAAKTIGFAVAVNDVDRFAPASDGRPGTVPDPGTYLSWNRGFDLFRRPSHFGRLELPARPAPAGAPPPSDAPWSPSLWVAVLAAIVLVVAAVGPGSKRLARMGPKPKAVMLALDVLLAGFLATSASWEERAARDDARTRIETAARAADAVAREAADLGALDANDAAARSRTLLRLLAGESVPAVPPVAAFAFVPLGLEWRDGRTTPAVGARTRLAPGVVEDWPLVGPTPCVALRARVDLDVDADDRAPTGRRPLGVLQATTDAGATLDLPLEVDALPAGERAVRLSLPAPATLVRLRYRHEEGAPSATLVALEAVREDGSETTVPLGTVTEDRVPVLARPGATSVRDGFAGVVVAPGERRAFGLPALENADRLRLVVTAERAFPVTRHGTPVAEVEIGYAEGPPTATTLVNGDDVDEERLIHAIRHPADMRSRVAYRWTDGEGIPHHHDLVAIPIAKGRRPTTLAIRNVGSRAAEQGTGAVTLVAATLSRRVASGAPEGLLTLGGGDAASSGAARETALVRDPGPFRDVLARGPGEAQQETREVGPDSRRTTIKLAAALPARIAARREATETALVTCVLIAAGLAVLLLVDVFQRFRRLSPKLVGGVLVAALVPVAFTIGLADRNNATRLETEREARLRASLSAARSALGTGGRQEAQVGAQGLLQLVSSTRAEDTRNLLDAVGIYRRQGIVGGGATAVLVKGRDVPTLVVQPETSAGALGGSSFLAERADAPGLYASPWDGLLLVATARSVGEGDWRKVVVAARVDDDFVEGRVAPAIADKDVEIAVLDRTGAPAGSSGAGGASLARSLGTMLDYLRSGAGSRDGVLLRRVATDDGARMAVVGPLDSAPSPDAPAGWIAVAVPRRALDAAVAAQREELVGLGLAAAVLVACVAAMLARRIAGPVVDLARATDAMRRGEFDAALPPAGRDEVGGLALAFDQMRRDLAQRVGDLDFLRRAQGKASASLDLAAASQAGLDLFRGRWEPERSLLLLALSPTGPVVVRAEAGRSTAHGDRPVPCEPGGWLAEALGAGEPLVVSDARTDPRVAAEGSAGNRFVEDSNAWIAVPLRAGGEVQGLAVLAWAGAASLPKGEAAALLAPLGGVVALGLQNARLYRLAALDEATGLPGATAFESALRRDVDAALAGGRSAALLRIGLDGLERVALRRGVEAARLLARAAADALRSSLAGRVQAGRLREDELAVRLPGATREQALALAATVRERISAVEIRSEEGQDPLRTGASVGVAVCPEDARSVEFLLDAAERALAAARRDGGDRVEDVRRVDRALADVPPFEDGAVFRTERMVRVLDTARRVARTDSTVLLTGETGVGKEVVADLLHRRSLRASGPFVKVNTAAFPETLLESELFGHERGAFTGAEKRREGRFELADGGTLFLDEVGEMTLPAQVRLLRVLAEGQFTRLGGTKPVEVDVRLVAATNRDLEKDVAAGRFREDLYYRLNVLRIEIPPLRERREEIPSLVDHFLGEMRRRLGRGPARFSPQAMDVLYRHAWPGNVRELRNVIERAAVLCEGEVAGPEHLRIDPPRGVAAAAAAPVAAPMDFVNVRQRKLLDRLAADGRCTNREFIELTGASPRTGLRDLQELMARGLIVREGRRRGAVYRLP